MNRFYKPSRKIKSTTRIGSIKRARDNINNAMVNLGNLKNNQRYGSVPKNIASSNNFQAYKNHSNEASYYLSKPHEEVQNNLNNSFPSIKNSNTQSSSAVFNYAVNNSK